jgi:ligand-binding SRPBCC domain-containing protein
VRDAVGIIYRRRTFRIESRLSATGGQMIQHFETRQWVPFPLERVFAFLADPRNLPRLMPTELQTRIEETRLVPPPIPQTDSIAPLVANVSAGVGSEVVVSFRPVTWMPRRITWLARIVEFVWNSHTIDEQIRGPFARFHHRHSTRSAFREGIEGTVARDEIEYALPFGFLSRPANAFVKQQLEQSFAWRQQRLAQILSIEARLAEAQLLRDSPIFSASAEHRDPSHFHPQ